MKPCSFCMFSLLNDALLLNANKLFRMTNLEADLSPCLPLKLSCYHSPMIILLLLQYLLTNCLDVSLDPHSSHLLFLVSALPESGVCVHEEGERGQA